MTRRNFIAVAKRVDLSTFPIPLRIKVSAVPGYLNRVEVSAAAAVPDRDDPGKTFPTVPARECFDVGYLADERDVVARVRAVASRALLHELDEHLKVDGRRPFDPHA
jgi:hypothetical protein